jgi:3-keto-5-aminohexanoate cleavage enzyme
MNKLIITAAICGAEVSKAGNPHVPYTIEEIGREAEKAHIAGASIIHLHVRNDDGTPTQDKKRFAACFKEIKNRCPSVIIQPTTGGAVGMTGEERLQPLYLDPSPEMATLDCGTMNFGGDDIFINSEKMIIEFAEKMYELNVKPELECFDAGMIDTALRLHNKGYIKAPMHYNIILGVIGGMNATVENLVFLINKLPMNATFTVTGIGRNEFPMAALAIVLGGHVRVGFEDNLYLAKGIVAKSNGQLVEKARELANLLGRKIASPKEARQILNL